MQNNDRSANFLENISRNNSIDKLINDEGNRLLEIEIKKEKKRKEHLREKKWILVGVAPGELKIKMTCRYKCTSDIRLEKAGLSKERNNKNELNKRRTYRGSIQFGTYL